MAANDLGVPDRAALLALMAAGREVSNRDLEELAGFRLSGTRLTKLRDRDLVSSRKDGQMWIHKLTDKGLAWCADELTASAPPRAGSAGGALYAVLAGLHRYLDRSGLTLSEVFRAAALAAGNQAGTPAGVDAPATAPAQASVAATDVTGQVREAYRQLVPRPRGWVRMADLRQRLGTVPRQEVDAALRELSRSRVANLVPQANQKVLTQADREAAVRIGTDDCHLVSLEDHA